MKLGARVAATLLTVLVFGTARELAQGERALASADAAIARHDEREAVAQARLAAESIVPFTPYAREGHERLAQIASDAETRGDDAVAALAWRAARAAAMETRAIGSPSAIWRARAETGLARVAARTAAREPSSAVDASTPAREAGPTSWELLLLATTLVALTALAARFAGRARKSDVVLSETRNNGS